MAKDLSKLRDDAAAALAKGRFKKALESYLALEKREPADGSWAQRAADAYRRLGRTAESIAALERAADRYARAGFLVKAVAVCKMILQQDPEHSATVARLGELNAARGIPAVRTTPAAAPVAAPPVPPPSPAVPPGPPAPVVPASAPASPPGTRTLPPGAPLESVALGQVVPGSRREPWADDDSGIYDIPLDDDLSFELDLEPEPDAGGADPAQATAALRGTPLFSELSAAGLQRLIERVGLVELSPGAVLFREGDPGEALYVVVDGEVAVVSEGPPRVQLSRLGEGSFFGEVALVTDQPRSATVEAVEAARLLAVDRDAIGELVEQEPAVLTVLLRFLRERLIDRLVATSPLFGPFGGAERRALISRFRFLEAGEGASLVTQGKMAEGLFVLLSGRAEVLRTGSDGAAQRLTTLGAGDLFGEMSLLAHEPAVATVRTTTKALGLLLPAAVFREVIMTHPQVLMFVGELAEERRRKNDAIVEGRADFEVAHIELF